MNYSDIIKILDNASAFDLYRLHSMLDKMIDDPRRIVAVKAALRQGQKVQCFEPKGNSVFEGTVEQIKQTRAVVRRTDDGRRWDIPLCAINTHVSDISITPRQTQGLTKAEIQVGDTVGFLDKSGLERSGRAVRLNQKTVTVESAEGSWRVGYSLLHKIIDAKID